MVALRDERRKRHLTQAELAKAVGMTTATISRYETGKRRISIKAAKVIAPILGIKWIRLIEEDTGPTEEVMENENC